MAQAKKKETATEVRKRLLSGGERKILQRARLFDASAGVKLNADDANRKLYQQLLNAEEKAALKGR